MADKFLEHGLIFIKTCIQGFSGPLITNPTSDFENSKWRIQYGRQIFRKWSNFYKNLYPGDFRTPDYKSDVRF